jgi:hypothetical protein
MNCAVSVKGMSCLVITPTSCKSLLPLYHGSEVDWLVGAATWHHRLAAAGAAATHESVCPELVACSCILMLTSLLLCCSSLQTGWLELPPAYQLARAGGALQCSAMFPYTPMQDNTMPSATYYVLLILTDGLA